MAHVTACVGRLRTWVCLTALAIVGQGVAQAQLGSDVGVRQVRHGTPHDALYDVSFEGRRGIAVGSFGQVLVTVDGGTNWEKQSFPMSNLALLSVAMREGHCIAVGQTGLVFASEDCKSWRAVSPLVKNRLLSVAMNRRGVAYAVGAFGTILKSTDWGKSWAEQKVDWSRITADGAEPHLYAVHVADDGVATAVGEFELVLRADGEQPWKVLHKGERSLFALSVTDDGQMYACGQSGALLKGAEGGTKWQSLTTGISAILTGVRAISSGVVLATGINATVASRDGGASWIPVHSKLVSKSWHQAVGASNAANGKPRLFAVGAGGSILEFDI